MFGSDGNCGMIQNEFRIAVRNQFQSETFARDTYFKIAL